MIRHQINERVVRFGQVNVHSLHHFFSRVWAGYSKHLGVQAGNQLLAFIAIFRTQAAGHNHLAVGVHGLADGVQAFLYGAVNKSTGVNNDQVGPFIGGGHVVPLYLELGQNSLGIH